MTRNISDTQLAAFRATCRLCLRMRAVLCKNGSYLCENGSVVKRCLPTARDARAELVHKFKILRRGSE